MSLLQLQQERLQTGTQQRGRILLQTKAHDLLEESASSMASMLAKTHAALSLWLKQTGKIRAKLQAEANGEEKAAAAAEDAKLSPEEEECGAMKTSYNVEPGRSWGSLPEDKKGRWRELDCDHNLPATEAPAPEKEAPKNDGAPTQKEEDVPDFSEFIFDQKASSDACSARLLEAKKAKDTLSKEMFDLSSTIEGHVEVQTTETENLKISAQTIEQVRAKNKELREECDKEGLDVDAQADKYDKELEELRQIADPEVRHQAVIGKGTGEEGLIETEMNNTLIDQEQSKGKLSLASFSREQCLSFIEWRKKRQKKSEKKEKQKSEPLPPPVGDRECDEEREELQLAFTKAYKEIAHLAQLTRGNIKVARQECLDDVEAQLVNHLAPMLSMRESSMNRLQIAQAAIQQLTPLLDSAGVRVERLKEHLESLKAECVEAGDASEQLKTMRALIFKLEHCPGRNNFNLEVPEIPAAPDA